MSHAGLAACWLLHSFFLGNQLACFVSMALVKVILSQRDDGRFLLSCLVPSHSMSQVTSEKGETSWRRGGTRQRPEEWQESFELCRWCTPEEVKGVKVHSMPLVMHARRKIATLYCCWCWC